MQDRDFRLATTVSRRDLKLFELQECKRIQTDDLLDESQDCCCIGKASSYLLLEIKRSFPTSVIDPFNFIIAYLTPFASLHACAAAQHVLSQRSLHYNTPFNKKLTS